MDARVGDCSSAIHRPQRQGEGGEEAMFGVRKGPWTVEEDSLLVNYVAVHGEGRWNAAAASAGLRRTGKSCRLRWLNYLRPDVRRGNITLQEQLLILQLHSQWGNRWSKISQYLPGRTDNEIKNYWRTRVQKQAKQLKCDVNSKQFRDTMRHVWMPRLLERIQANSGSGQLPTSPTITTSYTTDATTSSSGTNHRHAGMCLTTESGSDPAKYSSDDSLGVAEGPPGSDLKCADNSQNGWDNVCESWGRSNPGWELQGFEQQNDACNWLDGGDSLESLWSEENIWFLQQQLRDDGF